MTEEKVWYVYYKNQTYGPYPRYEIIKLLKDGILKYSDYIFREGFKDWEYIYNVPEFDRRLLNPGGNQPIIEHPKDPVPEASKVSSLDKTTGEELWFVHDGTNKTGPFKTSYIKEGLEKKTLFWTYYVWREGFKDWVQIKECKEFDRRVNPRGLSPETHGIVKDFNVIKQKSVVKIPDSRAIDKLSEEERMMLEKDIYKYSVSDINQEELRDKYPVKAILFLIFIILLLFGSINSYPLIVKHFREKRALTSYEQAIELIKEGKEAEGHTLMFDLIEIFPNTRAKRKAESFFITREPIIKASLSDEARRVKRLIQNFVSRYSMLPMNALDINYVPPFYLTYFGEMFYKQNKEGKIEVMAVGKRNPVKEFVFIIDINDEEKEITLVEDELETKSLDYLQLRYKGQRTPVTPILKPRLIENKEVVKEEVKEEKKETDELEPQKEETNELAPVKREVLQRPIDDMGEYYEEGYYDETDELDNTEPEYDEKDYNNTEGEEVNEEYYE